MTAPLLSTPPSVTLHCHFCGGDDSAVEVTIDLRWSQDAKRVTCPTCRGEGALDWTVGTLDGQWFAFCESTGELAYYDADAGELEGPPWTANPRDWDDEEILEALRVAM